MLATVKEERAARKGKVAASTAASLVQNGEGHEQKAVSREQAAVSREQATVQLAQQMKALHRYVSSRMMGALQEQLHGDEMSFSQMSALHQLRAHAPMSVGGLAERTGLSLPAASHLTDRLVARGYAQRRENPDDRRAKLLDLSEQGRQFLDTLDRRFTDSYQLAFAQVSLETVQLAADSLSALLSEVLVSEVLLSKTGACSVGAPTTGVPAPTVLPPASPLSSKEPA
jgi:MarR family transcriptional regulator, organic hydroperoxide resistance regulator